MASVASDQFNRPNRTGLGVADTGQTWRTFRGTPGNILNNRAHYGYTFPGSFDALNVGAGGGDFTGSINFSPHDRGGQSLYFRIASSNNWWRLAKVEGNYSYQTIVGYTDPVYGFVGNGTFSYRPAGAWVLSSTHTLLPGDQVYGTYKTVYGDFDSRINTYKTRYDVAFDKIHYYTTRVVYENTDYVIVKESEPIYQTVSGTSAAARLERCVNGAVTTVQAFAVAGSITNLTVVAAGDEIQCLSSGTALGTLVKDPTHKTAHWHGVGFAESTSNVNANGIDSFVATPSVIGGYVPAVML